MTRIFYALFLFSVMGACGSKDHGEKLTIAVASSGQFALKELANKFTQKTQIKVDVVAGSSGKLTAQILNGAPFDLFFSANMSYPEILYKGDKSIKKPVVYGYGVPVLWSLKGDLTKRYAALFLHNPEIKHVVIANPDNAPYGEMAIEFLKDNDLYDLLESKLVFGESIAQVNEYVLNETVDIGISAKSIVLSSKLNGKGSFIELGDKYRIQQGAIIISNQKSEEIAGKFLDYVISDEGVELLKSYGYTFK